MDGILPSLPQLEFLAVPNRTIYLLSSTRQDFIVTMTPWPYMGKKTDFNGSKQD